MELFQTPYQLHEKEKQVGKVLANDKADVMNIQLKKGQTIPTHNANQHVLIIVRSGVISFIVESETVELTAEQVLAMQPLENHSIIALEDADLLVVKLK